MSFSDMLPYISAFGPMLTVAGAAYLYQRAQWIQHGANSKWQERIEERIGSLEEIAKQITDVLVQFGRIDQRVLHHRETLDRHEKQIHELESREAGRRIGALKG